MNKSHSVNPHLYVEPRMAEHGSREGDVIYKKLDGRGNKAHNFRQEK